MRLFERVSQRRSLDRQVGRDGQFQDLSGGVLLTADVAAALTNDHPAVTLEGVHDLAVAEAGDLGQKTSSRISDPGSATMSSSTGSR